MPATSILLFLAAQAFSPAPETTGLPLTGAKAEGFLKTAEVTDLRYFDSTAATKPQRATLTDGQQTHWAVFKTVDSFGEKGTPTSGRSLHKLHDAYSHEIAAYELDKLLGLGIVPPCVAREIKGQVGSLCLWVDGAQTEKQLAKEDRMDPPDGAVFTNQMEDIRLFLQLSRDAEYGGASNILIDGAWKLYKIDSSRSFGAHSRLLAPGSLTRFRRSTVAALRSLTEEQVQIAMTPWLDEDEIRALWNRRNQIVDLIQERIDAAGEVSVLY